MYIYIHKYIYTIKYTYYNILFSMYYIAYTYNTIENNYS